MSHELILTSVSQGLDKAAGYCAVAEDARLPSALRERLTPLSAYHHFPNEAADETALLSSPLMYAYRTFSERDTIWYVLTRITPTGTDYRHLPNHLTHHILFNEDEQVPEGPAWLCALPNFHFAEWLTPSVRFPRGRSLPSLTSPQALTRRQWIARQRRYLDPQKLNFFDIPFTRDEINAVSKEADEQAALSKPPTSPCPAWRAATGDSGWGGILADTIRCRQSTVVLFRPGQNLLSLFVEAIALLPPKLRWAATFCTYANSEFPPDIDCRWLGVLADSPLAARLRHDRHRLVIDLTGPLGEVPYGQYVKFARSGADRDLPDDEDRTEPIEAEEETEMIQDSETVFQEERAEKTAVPVPPPLPIILPSEKFTIQPRSFAKKNGLFHRVLNMKGRGQFYLLYGITLLLVLFLLFLVVDQAGSFGIAQKIFNGGKVAKKYSPPKKKPSEKNTENKEKNDEQTTEEAGNTVPDSLEKVAVPTVSEEDKEKLTASLKSLQQNLPVSLAMPIPSVDDKGQLLPPEKVVFAELAGLYANAAALDLQFIPLISILPSKVMTKPDAEIGNTVSRSWIAYAVDESTQETPMFRFTLTEQGLAVEWESDGLENRYLYDTVFSSLGFLQLAVLDKPETALEIPLFEVVKGKGILFKELDGEKELTLELPFAQEPWVSVFKEKGASCSLQLEGKIVPDVFDGIKKIETEPTEPSRCVFRLETNVDYAVPKEDGSDTYEPVVLEIEGTAGFDKIVWKDRYEEQLKTWSEEREKIQGELTDKKRQLEGVKKELMGNSTIKELRDTRNQLDNEVKQLENNRKALENKLEKAPEAHKKTADNADICIKYSVYLVPADGGGRKLTIVKSE
ncbi:MAG: hypothetical protein LBN39_13175 [Planctomycetaceae bacterium]|jgi:hypothetical protein|nr:hypothetical protein [Planctomycetaceae bacterium]